MNTLIFFEKKNKVDRKWLRGIYYSGRQKISVIKLYERNIK